MSIIYCRQMAYTSNQKFLPPDDPVYTQLEICKPILNNPVIVSVSVQGLPLEVSHEG